MRKYKLKFFIVNLIAAAGISFSAYMNWWNGFAPKDADLAQILPFQLPDQISAMYPSAASVILVGAGFLLVASLFSLRSLAIAGLSIITFTAVSWFMHLGANLSSIDLNDGFYVVGASVLISVASMFLRRRQHESRKR
jgi:hypothetical protein